MTQHLQRLLSICPQKKIKTLFLKINCELSYGKQVTQEVSGGISFILDNDVNWKAKLTLHYSFHRTSVK